MCSTWATESCRRRIRTSCERSWGSSTSRLGGGEEAVMSRNFEGERTAVLLTAGGGANSLDGVGPVPLGVGGGGPTRDDLRNEFRERHPRIGREKTRPDHLRCPRHA